MWCFAAEPRFYNIYVTNCFDGRVHQAAVLMYDEEMFRNTKGKVSYAPNSPEHDASYCFLEGLCEDKLIHNETSADAAMRVCDERYGGDLWRTLFNPVYIKNHLKLYLGVIWSRIPLVNEGYTTPWMTHFYGLAACAMGTYQCDVTFCKEEFCVQDKWIKKYGQYSKIGATVLNGEWDKEMGNAMCPGGISGRTSGKACKE